MSKLRFLVYSIALHKSGLFFRTVILNRCSTAAMTISTDECDLFVTMAELLGETNRTASKRGHTSRLQQQIAAFSQRTRTQQHIVSMMLKGY
jgi:hypothetical protein